jgi:hypothetical protein
MNVDQDLMCKFITFKGDAKKKAEEEAKKAAAAALAHKLRMASYNNEVDKVKSLLRRTPTPTS